MAVPHSSLAPHSQPIPLLVTSRESPPRPSAPVPALGPGPGPAAGGTARPEQLLPDDTKGLSGSRFPLT